MPGLVWESVTRLLSFDGTNDRPRCSIGREFTVISPELLRPGGWKWLRRACSVWMPGDPGQFVGTATNLHDALVIYKSQRPTTRWRSPAKPDEIRQDRSS